jgi:pyruvate formate lyase activating enzyme
MIDTAQEGYVLNIQNYSVHDGAGIRTVVFLKGCPLRCDWCSNPESQRLRPELAYDMDKCLTPSACGWCLKSCPETRIVEIGGLLAMDCDTCSDAPPCAEACPGGALTVYGRSMSVEEVLREVEKDGAFYARSGGGMTLSGGEAMFQPDFALALLREARRRRIDTAMETCGHCGTDDLLEACALLDCLIFDIKSLSSERHRRGTGFGNELILENFESVCRACPDLRIHVRTPVIPGFNDTEEDIRAIAQHLPRRDRLTFELLPYHRMGQPKYRFLKRPFPMGDARLDPSIVPRLKALAAVR